MDLLIAELSTTGDAASALAFLATCVREHGGVAACIALYRKAVALAPRDASYALNYVHALELEHDYEAAARAGAVFCRGGGLTLPGACGQARGAVGWA